MRHIENVISRPVKMVSNEGYLLVNIFQGVAYNSPRRPNSLSKILPHWGQVTRTMASSSLIRFSFGCLRHLHYFPLYNCVPSAAPYAIGSSAVPIFTATHIATITPTTVLGSVPNAVHLGDASLSRRWPLPLLSSSIGEQERPKAQTEITA